MDRGYVFGPFELDLENGDLKREGRRVPLAPQPFELLAFLVTSSGRLVRREELAHHLWRDTHIDREQGLKSCVKQVRRALGDSSTSSLYIETVPKKGFRFVATVTPIATAEPSVQRRRARPRWITAVAAAATLALVLSFLNWRPEPSRVAEEVLTLAVLPFEDLSPDRSQPHVSEGFTDELITQLANLDPGRIRVIARTSSSLYRDASEPVRVIANELSASHILEGSLRRDGDLVRLTTRLVRAEDETPVWASTFDRRTSDWISLQTEVSRSVVDALAGRLLPMSATDTGVEPYVRNSYLRGLYLLRRGEPGALPKARRHLEAALESAPYYALAHQALAKTWLSEAFGGDREPKAALDSARRHAEQAIAIDTTLAEARATRAMVLWLQEWDWIRAQQGFEQAVALAPGDAAVRQFYAVFLAARGRHQRARAEIEIARRLDPLSVTVSQDAAWIQFFSGAYRDAIDDARRALELAPESFSAWYCLAVALQQEGRLEEARAAYRNMSHTAGVSDAALAASDASGGASVTEWWTDSARTEGPVLPDYDLALIHLSRGRIDDAFRALERSRMRLSGWITMVAVDPRLAPLRNDARYRELLDRMNL